MILAMPAIAMSAHAAAAETQVTFQAGPRTVPRYEVGEWTIEVSDAPGNPFVDVVAEAEVTTPDGTMQHVDGFCDSPDGSRYLVRYCPSVADADYHILLRVRVAGAREAHKAEETFRCVPSDRPGPVIVNPARPKHFMYAGTGEPFYHLGYTAYHLLDPTNDDETVRKTLDYCAEHAFNKVRFLLAGYPRDTDTRPPEQGGGRADQPRDVARRPVEEMWNLPNYGAPAGEVNALPAWVGEPHAYEFDRFNTDYWRKVERAVQAMRERGIVATCIFTIEKQDLPQEYGALTEAEKRFYRYAVARLAAFDNVWWDLGNEHNEYRDTEWGDTMGNLVKDWDPYDRLASVHAYDEFFYSGSDWADFIITQQYGTPQEVYDWALKYGPVPKPYVNEEYGYEYNSPNPGHGQNADLVRKCHWAIALAGGYATYGGWHEGSYYTGEPGPGQAARQLMYLRQLFEALPFTDMQPRADLVHNGPRLPVSFCLAGEKHLVIYLPAGGSVTCALPAGAWQGRWFDPRHGDYSRLFEASGDASVEVTAPSPDEDWALVLRAD